MSENALQTARDIAKRIRELDISINIVGYDPEATTKHEELRVQIDKFIRSEATNDGKALDHALDIIETHDWLVHNGNVKLNDSILTKYNDLARWYTNLKKDKDTLKADNEKLVEQTFKWQTKFELISEKYDKMIEGLEAQAAKGS